MKIELAKTEIIHFVGIGGIGMSGLALIMNGLGFKVQGSDITSNKNIERLKKNKIKIYIGHNRKNIQKSTILVISSAVKTTPLSSSITTEAEGGFCSERSLATGRHSPEYRILRMCILNVQNFQNKELIFNDFEPKINT